MRFSSLKIMAAAGTLILLTACAPRNVATPESTPAPDGNLTVIPAELTPLPTPDEPVATLPAPDRADFVAQDLTAEPWASVQQKLAAALAADESWAEDPDQIAMEFSTNPTALALAETIQRSDTHAIMLITELIGEDDSIAEQQVLLELSRPSATDAWVVDFIGLRWKCREGRGQQEFAPDLCA